MTIKEAVEIYFKMIPHWYGGIEDQSEDFIVVDSQRYYFQTSRYLTPQLKQLNRFVEDIIQPTLNFGHGLSDRLIKQMLQEKISLRWLSIFNGDIDWNKLIDFNVEMESRTYENDAVGINLLFDTCNSECTFDITDQSISKLIDPLGKDQNVFIQCSGDLKFKTYGYVPFDVINDADSYKFYPEFLHPFQSYKLSNNLKWSAHRTSRNDLVICDASGMKASYRKGDWHLYDCETFKNTITDILCKYSPKYNYWIGCNIYEVLFDLSYKRHGALLVYTNDPKFERKITNKESIIEGEKSDAVRKGLGSAFQEFALNTSKSSAIKKRLLIELSSMDGAVVFADSKLIAVGAMIETAADVPAAGARTSAALSAFKYGAFVFKVSSDGQITMFHRASNSKIEFM